MVVSVSEKKKRTGFAAVLSSLNCRWLAQVGHVWNDSYVEHGIVCCKCTLTTHHSSGCFENVSREVVNAALLLQKNQEVLSVSQQQQQQQERWHFGVKLTASQLLYPPFRNSGSSTACGSCSAWIAQPPLGDPLSCRAEFVSLICYSNESIPREALAR